MNKIKKSEPVSRSDLVVTLTTANARIAELENALAPVVEALLRQELIDSTVTVALSPTAVTAILAATKPK